MARKKIDTEEGRAVKIASVIMERSGLCRYDSPTKCHCLYADETACAKCIERWLLTKARAELRKEARI